MPGVYMLAVGLALLALGHWLRRLGLNSAIFATK